MATQHDKQFKLDAVKYYQSYTELGCSVCAENLGIGRSTLSRWIKPWVVTTKDSDFSS